MVSLTSAMALVIITGFNLHLLVSGHDVKVNSLAIRDDHVRASSEPLLSSGRLMTMSSKILVGLNGQPVTMF